MPAGQKSSSGAKTSPDDEKAPGRGAQAAEYKDMPANQRPKPGDEVDGEAGTDEAGKTDRPGFDLGGTNQDTSAGKGLGLGKDAKESRKGWGLPRT